MPALEKEMATHSSILAWRIPGTEEPGGLLSMGLHRVWTWLKWLSSSSSSRWIALLLCPVESKKSSSLWLFYPVFMFSSNWQCFCSYTPIKSLSLRRKWQSTPVFLPGKIPWTEEPGSLQSIALQKSRKQLKWLSMRACNVSIKW